MNGRAYYNEIDPFAAAWLHELIAAGHIAPGDVDERSIVDVKPDDLAGYNQCHFFAGIGGWSYALRLAGWDDARPVWTGSCPCQPFSAAGKGKAADDERHLWPRWLPLIAECRPAIVFGEQVEAAIGWGWLDLVFSDLEACGYACASAVLPACSVGAPHIRNRAWFVADADYTRGSRRDDDCTQGCDASGRQETRGDGAIAGRSGVTGGLADANGRDTSAEGLQRGGQHGQQPQDGGAGIVEHATRDGRIERGAEPSGRGTASGRSLGQLGDAPSVGRPRLWDQPAHALVGQASPWADAIWLPCTDGKARPTQSPIQFMADGLPESLGRVRPDQLQAFKDEIDGQTSEADRGQALLDLWHALAEETVRRAAGSGGLRSLQEAPVLLAYLCQLTEQGWPVPKGFPQSRAEAAWAIMRMLRGDDSAARSSRQRGLDGQQPEQSANAVRVLSSILARHAQAAWGDAYAKNARNAFPLASGMTGRVGRLRGAGNAIVPQVAAQFIRACE